MPEALKSHFLTSWLWPLTYDLADQTWPRYGPGKSPCKISCPYVKRFTCESAHRHTDRRTDTHTHGSDSMTSTANAGGNNVQSRYDVWSRWRTWIWFQDQKILELMLAKREDAKKEAKKREAARTAWEIEKQREATVKASAENARRRTLSEHRRLQENRRVSWSAYKLVIIHMTVVITNCSAIPIYPHLTHLCKLNIGLICVIFCLSVLLSVHL